MIFGLHFPLQQQPAPKKYERIMNWKGNKCKVELVCCRLKIKTAAFIIFLIFFLNLSRSQQAAVQILTEFPLHSQPDVGVFLVFGTNSLASPRNGQTTRKERWKIHFWCQLKIWKIINVKKINNRKCIPRILGSFHFTTLQESWMSVSSMLNSSILRPLHSHILLFYLFSGLHLHSSFYLPETILITKKKASENRFLGS